MNLVAKTMIDQRLCHLLTPVIESMGFELVRIRFMGKATPLLQLMVECPDGGITIDQCAEVSTTVSAVLDVEDPIESEYTLEVSSPGIDRPLTRQKDFTKYSGEVVKISTHDLIDGRRHFKGKLLGLKGESVLVETQAGEVMLECAQLSEAKLVLTEALLQASLKEQGQAEGALSEA